MKLYQWIARRLAQIESLEKPGGTYVVKPADVRYEVDKVVKNHMPSGSGYDSGTLVDWGLSTPTKIVFNVDFHHMDQHGAYDGWSCHSVIVVADLCFDFRLRVTGRDRNSIKELIETDFNHALLTDVDD